MESAGSRKEPGKFDYKKKYKEYYNPKAEPGIIKIPAMKFLSVRGQGNPNEKDGEYARAVSMLYNITYTIKMSNKGNHKIDGWFDYVAPPLEGFWWMESAMDQGKTAAGMDKADIRYDHKEDFQWISIMRVPDYVKKEHVEWAVGEAARKKNIDCSKVELITYEEGLCVQCMHYGPFEGEPETIERMEAYAEKQGYLTDISDTRFHHEIYLSDARKCDSQKWKTVIRHPLIGKDGKGVGVYG